MGVCATRESQIGPFATRTVELTKLVQHAKSTADGLQLSLWSLVSLWSHIPLQEVSELFHQFATKDDRISAIHLITALVLHNTEMSPKEKARTLLEFFDWKDKGELASADLLLVLSVGADVMGIADRTTFAALAASAFPAKTQCIADLSTWASSQNVLTEILSRATPAAADEPVIEQETQPRSSTQKVDLFDDDKKERDRTEPLGNDDDRGTVHWDSVINERAPPVARANSAKEGTEMETEEETLMRWTSLLNASLQFLEDSAARSYKASLDKGDTSSACTGPEHPPLTPEYLAKEYERIMGKISDVYSCSELPDTTAVWSRLERAKEIDLERAEGRFLAAVDSWMEVNIPEDTRLVDLEVDDPMGALSKKESAEKSLLEILNDIENEAKNRCLNWKLVGMDKFTTECPHYFRSKLHKMLKKGDIAKADDLADDRCPDYAFDEPVLQKLLMHRDIRESVSLLFNEEPARGGGKQPSGRLMAIRAESSVNAASCGINEKRRTGAATGYKSKDEVALTGQRNATRICLQRRWTELKEEATAVATLASQADGSLLKDNLARYAQMFTLQHVKDDSEVVSDVREITKLFAALRNLQEELAAQKEPDQFELAVPIEKVLEKLAIDETLDVARLHGSATLSEALDTIRALLVDKKLSRLHNVIWHSWLGVSSVDDTSVQADGPRHRAAKTVARRSLESLSFSKAPIDVDGVLDAVKNLMQACSEDSVITADEPLILDALLALPALSESNHLSLLLHDPPQPEFVLYLRAWAIAQHVAGKSAEEAGRHLLRAWRRRRAAVLEARALQNETARVQLAAREYLDALNPSDAMHLGFPLIDQTKIGVEKELTKCLTEDSFVKITGSLQALAMVAELARH